MTDEERYVKAAEQLDHAHALMCSALARVHQLSRQYDPLSAKPDHPKVLKVVAGCRDRYRTLAILAPAVRQLFEVT